MSPLFLFVLFVGETFGCAATSGGEIVTTTVTSPTVTTTVATQTTTTTNSCTSCTDSQVTLTPATGGDNNIPATSSNPGPNAAGCLQLNVICAGPAGTIAFMQFNGAQGGPLENAGMTPTVTALLVCTNGQWLYNNERAVTEVNCSAA